MKSHIETLEEYPSYKPFASNLLKIESYGNRRPRPYLSKEETYQRMQKIFDTMYFYGFKPTCDIIDKQNKEK
tara:strand:+ start:526 stop:741 length:216 start_codon:yes stop_codon:yes gene_type:complete